MQSRHMVQQRRRYKRGSLKEVTADISNGVKAIGGAVQDVSCGGFSLGDLPTNFQANEHNYKAVIVKGGRPYKMLVTPCWSKIDDQSGMQQVGFKILDAPWEWVEMTTMTIPEFDYEDVDGFLA